MHHWKIFIELIVLYVTAFLTIRHDTQTWYLLHHLICSLYSHPRSRRPFPLSPTPKELDLESQGKLPHNGDLSIRLLVGLLIPLLLALLPAVVGGGEEKLW